MNKIQRNVDVVFEELLAAVLTDYNVERVHTATRFKPIILFHTTDEKLSKRLRKSTQQLERKRTFVCYRRYVSFKGCEL